MMIVVFFIALFLFSACGVSLPTKSPTELECSEMGDCLSTPIDCNEKCGCDKVYIYKKETDECVINAEYLKIGITEKYHNEEKLRLETEKVFKGIVMSAWFFVSCASLCTISACIYCFRIHYIDHKLHKELEALQKRLNKEGKFKKPRKEPRRPIAESCNVIVEDAGVFVC